MGQNNVAVHDHSSTIERIVAHGDLSTLSPQQRSQYFAEVCESLGLNPLTRPLEYIKLNGKLVLYARKDATDQLRKIYDVSISITNRQRIGDIYIVTAKAKLPNGREDEATGALPVHGLEGNDLANAFMKAETKAKRRVTLSICGLGILDESELGTVDGATPVEDMKAGQIEKSRRQKVKAPERDVSPRPTPKAKEAEAKLKEEHTAPKDTESQTPDDLADFTIRCGKKYKGQKLGDIPSEELSEYLTWLKDYTVKRRIPLTGDFLDFYRNAKTYLAAQGAEVPNDEDMPKA